MIDFLCFGVLWQPMVQNCPDRLRNGFQQVLNSLGFKKFNHVVHARQLKKTTKLEAFCNKVCENLLKKNRKASNWLQKSFASCDICQRGWY